MNRVIFPLPAFAILLISVGASLAQDDRLTPEQALGKLTAAEGLQVKTFASDPGIVSISNLDVDHRGRVWACEAVNYRGNRGKRPEGDRILIHGGKVRSPPVARQQLPPHRRSRRAGWQPARQRLV